MADFRKWVVMFAVLVATVSVASAQPFSCTASAGQTPVIRQEGLTELVGDTLLTCTGGTAGAVTNINVQIFMNTNVTSRIVNSNTGEMESLLILDEAGSALPGAPAQIFGGTGSGIGTVFSGRKAAGDNSIAWLNIPVMQPGPNVPGAPATQRTIRLSNIRVNANGIPGSVLPGVGIGTVTEFIAVQGGTSFIPLANPTITVAAVSSGLVTDLRGISRDAAGTFTGTGGFSNIAIALCQGRNTGLAGDLTKNGLLDFGLRFREPQGFATSFKPRGTAAQNVPGTLYPTESGLTGVAGLPFAYGGADTGTRFYARFTNVPQNVQIFVTRVPISTSTGLSSSLVSFDPSSPAFGSSLGTGVTGTLDGFPIAKVPIDATGTGSAVWEIATADPFLQDSVTFGVAIALPANQGSVAAPTIQVNMGFAPLSTNNKADVGYNSFTGAGSAIPRFMETVNPKDVANVNACVTNLLFPYLTNQGGFDTGIAIVNTSKDNAGDKKPFNTTMQTGTCTLYYFGAMGNGGSLPTQVTPQIAGGNMSVFALSQGGPTADQPSAATFQGYMIARCNFQFAHGFAFVSDVGVNRVAHGYLALVIPDRGGSRVADPFTTAGSASGEQLGY